MKNKTNIAVKSLLALLMGASIVACSKGNDNNDSSSSVNIAIDASLPAGVEVGTTVKPQINITGTNVKPTITLKDPTGADVSIGDDYSFVANKTGVYTLTVSVQEETKTFTIIVSSDATAPTVVTTISNKEEVKGATHDFALDLAEIEATDNQTEVANLEKKIKTVTSDGKFVEVKDNKATFEKAGVYTVNYSVSDENGNEAELSYTITVNGLFLADANFVDNVWVTEDYKVPTPELIGGKGTLSVKYVDGENELDTEVGANILFANNGTGKLVYTLKDGDDVIDTLEKEITVNAIRFSFTQQDYNAQIGEKFKVPNYELNHNTENATITIKTETVDGITNQVNAGDDITVPSGNTKIIYKFEKEGYTTSYTLNVLGIDERVCILEEDFPNFAGYNVSINKDAQYIKYGTASLKFEIKPEGVAKIPYFAYFTNWMYGKTFDQSTGYNQITMQVYSEKDCKVAFAFFTGNTDDIVSGDNYSKPYELHEGWNEVTVNFVTDIVKASISLAKVTDGITKIGVYSVNDKYSIGMNPGAACGEVENTIYIDYVVAENHPITINEEPENTVISFDSIAFTGSVNMSLVSDEDYVKQGIRALKVVLNGTKAVNSLPYTAYYHSWLHGITHYDHPEYNAATMKIYAEKDITIAFVLGTGNDDGVGAYSGSNSTKSYYLKQGWNDITINFDTDVYQDKAMSKAEIKNGIAFFAVYSVSDDYQLGMDINSFTKSTDTTLYIDAVLACHKDSTVSEEPANTAFSFESLADDLNQASGVYTITKEKDYVKDGTKALKVTYNGSNWANNTLSNWTKGILFTNEELNGVRFKVYACQASKVAFAFGSGDSGAGAYSGIGYTKAYNLEEGWNEITVSFEDLNNNKVKVQDGVVLFGIVMLNDSYNAPADAGANSIKGTGTFYVDEMIAIKTLSESKREPANTAVSFETFADDYDQGSGVYTITTDKEYVVDGTKALKITYDGSRYSNVSYANWGKGIQVSDLDADGISFKVYSTVTARVAFVLGTGGIAGGPVYTGACYTDAVVLNEGWNDITIKLSDLYRTHPELPEPKLQSGIVHFGIMMVSDTYAWGVDGALNSIMGTGTFYVDQILAIKVGQETPTIPQEPKNTAFSFERLADDWTSGACSITKDENYVKDGTKALKITYTSGQWCNASFSDWGKGVTFTDDKLNGVKFNIYAEEAYRAVFAFGTGNTNYSGVGYTRPYDLKQGWNEITICFDDLHDMRADLGAQDVKNGIVYFGVFAVTDTYVFGDDAGASCVNTKNFSVYVDSMVAVEAESEKTPEIVPEATNTAVSFEGFADNYNQGSGVYTINKEAKYVKDGTKSLKVTYNGSDWSNKSYANWGQGILVADSEATGVKFNVYSESAAKVAFCFGTGGVAGGPAYSSGCFTKTYFLKEGWNEITVCFADLHRLRPDLPEPKVQSGIVQFGIYMVSDSYVFGMDAGTATVKGVGTFYVDGMVAIKTESHPYVAEDAKTAVSFEGFADNYNQGSGVYTINTDEQYVKDGTKSLKVSYDGNTWGKTYANWGKGTRVADESANGITFKIYSTAAVRVSFCVGTGGISGGPTYSGSCYSDGVNLVEGWNEVTLKLSDLYKVQTDASQYPDPTVQAGIVQFGVIVVANTFEGGVDATTVSILNTTTFYVDQMVAVTIPEE